MNGQQRMSRWGAVLVAVIGAIIVGAVAYQFGVSHGLAISGQAAGAPPAAFGPYGWYRPWGLGFLFPLVFFGFWLLVFRGFCWGGRWRRWQGGPPYDAQQRFDEWHKRAHEQMKAN